ncbi:MAG: L-threonylcarbamoyladenylate synthase [Chitinophagaceae bacterium]
MQTTISTNISLAVSLLTQNEVIGFPTETVYGLAGNALEPDAVVKIFNAKNRPYFNPLIVHVKNIEAINEYAYLDELSLQLATSFMPGSLTLLLPKKKVIPDIVTAGSDKVAIRIPNHPIALSVLNNLSFPLAAPSANVFGYVSPVTAEHVFDGLNGKIPLVLDGGKCTVGLESTIVEVQNEQVYLHRVGGIAVEQIEAVVGKALLVKSSSDKPSTAGQLKSHYATNTPLFQGDIDTLMLQHQHKKVAIISFCNKYHAFEHVDQIVLSSRADLNEAAQNLFLTFRNFDSKGYDAILVEDFPNVGLGRAINDRIQRAQYINK